MFVVYMIFLMGCEFKDAQKKAKRAQKVAVKKAKEKDEPDQPGSDLASSETPSIKTA